jgi:predicted metal-binding membrane protein
MTSTFADTRVRMASAMQYFFWRHPEWWTAVICASGWGAMLLRGREHAGQGVFHSISFGQELASWMVMVAAMMLPLVFHSVWLTAISSLWARRHRAMAGFLVGYFAPWLTLGVMAASMRRESWTHHYSVVALFFFTAALWQLTPMHKRATVACHRTQPLAPLGWQADRDCLRFGSTIGIACVSSCWPLMLACALAGHALIAMIAGMIVSVGERWFFRQRAAALLTLAIASYYTFLAALYWG